MKLIVASDRDEASILIRDCLLQLPGWRLSSRGSFAGSGVYEHRDSDLILITIPDLHLHHDFVDVEARTRLGFDPGDLLAVIFLSKHRAESGTRSLTVHPIGNFGPADLGGISATLVPAAPEAMTAALRGLARRAGDLGFRATFEATHHGPFLSTPAFFCELGSGPADWKDGTAAQALAEVVLDCRETPSPVGIGFGGGHYVPRITDVALHRGVAFGHLVPSYVVAPHDDALIDRVVAATPRATFAYLHRKALRPEDTRRIEEALKVRGIPVLREADLPRPQGAQSSSPPP